MTAPASEKHYWRNIEELADEVRAHLRCDTPENIARRLGYKNLKNLCATLDRNGYQALSSRLETAQTWIKYGGPPPPTNPRTRH